MQLGKLEKIDDLRKIWLYEMLDFSQWLAEGENLVLLCDAVGNDMTFDETGSSVGSFKGFAQLSSQLGGITYTKF